MTPALALITFAVAWLVAMAFGLSFVHGAQLLRREELAAMYDANHEQPAGPAATVASLTPAAEQLPAAA